MNINVIYGARIKKKKNEETLNERRAEEWGREVDEKINFLVGPRVLVGRLN